MALRGAARGRGGDRGAPAGFALYFHNFSTFLGKPGIYLEDLYVRPGFTRFVLGRALLAHLAGIARDRGRLEWSVLDWNEPAIGLYKSTGASRVGGWTTYRVTGAALEELALRP